MRRVWLVVLAIVSLHSVLISGCTGSPPRDHVEHEGNDRNGGGMGGGHMM